MVLNIILLCIITISLILLYRQLRKSKNIDNFILSPCEFTITRPEYEINENIRIAKFNVSAKDKNRYFRDFPLEFKFYSEQCFKSKIKISCVSFGDDEMETIYNKIVEFDSNAKEHIYYINDIILGTIEIEIYTDSIYGKPTILFEILQNNLCHMMKEHKVEIKFPY